MLFSRILLFALFSFCVGLAPIVVSAEESIPEPVQGEDGLYKHTWFLESFLDLKEDLEEAAAEKKHFVVWWEQRGCPYCERTHLVNLRIPKIVNLIKKKFTIVQLNLWGDKDVTDFDGKIIKEKDLARKWSIRFTPTIQFFHGDPKRVGKKPGNKAEVMRVPGYFKPFHFYMLFKYVDDRAYDKEPNFQRWLIGEGVEMRKEGINIDKLIWADDLKLK